MISVFSCCNLYLLTRVSIEVHDMRGISMIICSHFTEVVCKVISNWIITTVLIVLQCNQIVNNVQLLIYWKPVIKSKANKTRSSERKIGSKI